LQHVNTNTATGVAMQRLAFDYDLDGMVRQFRNNRAPGGGIIGGSVSHQYRYDPMHQLVGASGSYFANAVNRQSYTFSADYDEIGNMVRQQRTTTVGPRGATSTRDWLYQYTGSRPHAPSVVGDRSFAYL
jgi:hypothetical protein